MTIKQTFFLILYYGIAKHLPASHLRFSIGGKLRFLCAKNIFKKCGKNVNIERGAYFGNGLNVEIGDNSGIGINCHVPNDIIIGENVMMGPKCFFLERFSHKYSRTDIPMIKQGGYLGGNRTCIGDDVWIGRQVIVLSGKTIGSHSIIGAGSVVSNSIPEYSVAVGNPIRVVKDRRKNAKKD